MRNHVLLVLFLLELSACQGGTATVTGSTWRPIVNGTRDPQTVALTAAQVMAIGWLYSEGAPSRPFCTGTLISPNVVVTAAHCTYGGGAGEIGFGVGQDPNAPDALFTSIGVFPNREADAALILLSEDATAGEVEIAPIPVNQAALDPSLVGRAVQAGGYGMTYDPSRDGRWFATVYVAEVNPGEVVVDGRGEQGICYGDSGSGLVDLDVEGNPVVLAVESWGDASCVDIDHLTRLDPLFDWIGPVLEGEIPPDPCEGVGEEGRCVDTVAESCRRGTLRQTDCATWGAECTFIEEAGRYGCPCGDLGEFSWCDGDVVESCREGRIRQMNCGIMGASCGYVAAEGAYTCTEDPRCLPEDEEGRCEGDVAINCASGRTSRDLCYLEGLGCVVTADGAICGEPGADGDADADVDGDADGDDDGDGGADADADADGDGGEDGDDDDGGCSCRVASPTGGGLARFVAVALDLLTP